MFFQTILMNSPLAPHVRADVEFGVHFINWSGHRSHPATLTQRDVGRLRASPHLFARKFDMTIDASVLDELDALVRS
jgi:hypothetical protein